MKSADWDGPDSPLAQVVRDMSARNVEAILAQQDLLREQANIEQTVVEGGYNTKQVNELIQNASDAMDGLEGRLEVVLTDTHLYCANEGIAFQEQGIRSIMMSHSSSKDSDDIGRFGLGFKSVLVLTDAPEIYSRSASFRWDREYLRQRLDARSALRETDALPVLRVAEPLDPRVAAQEDPVLDSLMDWASTVVRLPLKEAVPWLGAEVQEFPGAFLLFSDKIGTLVLDDRSAGNRVEWTARRDADRHVTLTRNGVEEIWNVFELEHKPSATAREEAGRLAAREELAVKWAVPRSGPVKRGELWTHFPTTSTTTLSGIINAPFKMNEDRHNLLECRYNEEILTRTLPWIVSGALHTIVDPKFPARMLGLLPARGRESQSWADKVLNEAVWQAVASVPCLPDTRGELHPADQILVPDLNASQDDDDRELAEFWYGIAARFDVRGWIDFGCIANRDLNAKVDRILELGKTPRRPVQEWIDAVVDPADLDSIEAALRLVQRIQRSYSKFLPAALQTHTVRDSAGDMRHPITTELSFPADLSEPADGSPQIIDPALVNHGECHTILLDLGFKVMDAHGRLHRQLTLVKRHPQDAELMSSAWKISRGADKPVRVAQIFSEYLRAEDVLVRCVDRAWRPLGKVWLKGRLFPSAHSGDAELLIDSNYHAHDLQVLQQLDARQDLPQDQIRTSSRSEPFYARWADIVAAELTDELKKDDVPVTAKHVRLGEVYLTRGVDQLCQASHEIRHRVTLRLLRHQLFPTTPSLSGMYQERLPEVPQPDLWWIQKYGYLDTYYGLLPVQQCVGGVSGYPEDSLPRPKDTSAEAALNLPSHPDQINWSEVLNLAGRNLALKRLHDLYGRVAMQGGPRPEQLVVRSGGSRRPVVAEVCVVTTSDRTAQHVEATDDKSYVIQVDSNDQAAALVGNWGLPRLDITFSTSIDYRATQDVTRLTDTLPYVREVTSKIPSTLRVQWCSQVSLVEGNDHDMHRIQTPVAEYLDRAHRTLYIRGAANPMNLWSALRRTYGLAETAQELDLTHRRIQQEHAEDEMTEAERWVAALGQEAFESVLPGTAVDMVESLSGHRITAEELFQLAKTVHGVDLLQELKRHFAEQNGSTRVPEKSAVWQHFRGMVGSAAPQRSAARPPAREEVMGPVTLKPLHDYQRTVIDKITHLLDGSSEHRRGLLMLPTGAGKTRAMTEALVRHVASSQNEKTHLIVWSAHTKELCEQAVETWKIVWQSIGAVGERMAVSRFYEGNREQAEPEKVRLHLVVSTPQTMVRIVEDLQKTEDYRWLFGADVVVADEAHGSISPTYTRIFDAFGRDHRNKNKVTLGMTATPYRGQDAEGTKRLVGRYSGNLIQPDEFDTPTAHAYLQELGVLSRVEHEVLEGMTLLRKPTGRAPQNEDEEFDDDGTTRMAELYLDLEAVAGNSERNQILLQHLLERGTDGTSIVFAATVAHAEALAATLRLRKIPAAAISGATSASARRTAVEDFRAGRIKVLTNYNVLSEGFDAPGVDAVYVARPTFSPNRYLQMIGRGLRGPKNGGSGWTTIVNVQDNVSAFGTKLAFDHFEHLWTPALV